MSKMATTACGSKLRKPIRGGDLPDIFYQIGTIKDKEGKEAIDRERLNFVLRRIYEVLGNDAARITALEARIADLEAQVNPS